MQFMGVFIKKIEITSLWTFYYLSLSNEIEKKCNGLHKTMAYGV